MMTKSRPFISAMWGFIVVVFIVGNVVELTMLVTQGAGSDEFGFAMLANTVAAGFSYTVMRFLEQLPTTVHRPPGSRLLPVLRLIYTKAEYERVLLPLVSDMHEEYFEALRERDLARARF